MSDDFYLTLPSNAGQNTCPSSFRITLPRNVKLIGEWEVALVELIYPCSWYNVQEPIPLLLEAEKEGVFENFVGLIPGHYTHIKHVLYDLSASLPSDYGGKVKFKYVDNANRVEIMIKKPVAALQMPSELVYMLGYDLKTYDKTKPGIAPHPPDLRMGFSTFYVYCDIVEQSVVGDALAPLLRAVAAEGKFGDIVDRIFDHPHYVPVLKKQFDSIEIAIKTDQNKPLPLQYGKTVAKLHFKRRRAVPFFL